MADTLRQALARALDPAMLLRSQGLEPDRWQADLLRSDWQQALLLCHRQAGKSTVTATLALHEALFRPPALILLLSPSLRQSGELFRKVLECYRALPDAVPVAQESALRLELANGSRIVSLPGQESTIRGYSGVRLLVVDEAARVPDELYIAIRPMLAVSRGRLIALSTPFGKRGWFHAAWHEGGGAWERVKVTADSCTRIDRAFLSQERRALGERWWRQEYLCVFSDTTDSVFGYEDVMGALSAEVEPLFGAGPAGTAAGVLAPVPALGTSK